MPSISLISRFFTKTPFFLTEIHKANFFFRKYEWEVNFSEKLYAQQDCQPPWSCQLRKKSTLIPWLFHTGSSLHSLCFSSSHTFQALPLWPPLLVFPLPSDLQMFGCLGTWPGSYSDPSKTICFYPIALNAM